MTTDPDPSLRKKEALRAELCARLRKDLGTLQRAHADATQGITHEDARQESDKDMRATEASYVARGQARRVVELQEELTALEALELRSFGRGDPVALGALVTVTLARGHARYFIAPAAAGLVLTVEEEPVRVVTPRSPLGQALLGRGVDDDVVWPTPQGELEGSIAIIE